MRQFLAALKFSLKEQLTNKFAVGLLVVFVPLWYWVLGLITPSDEVPFRFAPTGDFLQVNGHQLIFLTAGLNVLAMILGFMFFHSARKALAFDRRLTRAGLNRSTFMLAKALTLMAVTAVLSVYALVILLAFWHNPHNAFEVWLGFWLVSLTYASFGLLLGLLVSNELVGFFTVIMVSQMDVFLQAPIDNPAANKAFLKYLPSYGAEQLSTAGGFTHFFALRSMWLAAAWFASILLVALGVFYLRTQRKSSVLQVPGGTASRSRTAPTATSA